VRSLAAGLKVMTKAGCASEKELASRLRVIQRAYAHWERNPVALRPDQLLSLAQA
jgi:hypothetical protein